MKVDVSQFALVWMLHAGYTFFETIYLNLILRFKNLFII